MNLQVFPKPPNSTLITFILASQVLAREPFADGNVSQDHICCGGESRVKGLLRVRLPSLNDAWQFSFVVARVVDSIAKA